MNKFLNGLLYFLKFVLYIFAFCSTLFIMVKMYSRLHKDILSGIFVFLPYGILLVLFIINIFLKQKKVSGNIFYNLTCCLVFSVICVISYRSIFDKNMILNDKLGFGVNFNFYDYSLPFLSISLYGLCISNLFFMVNLKEKNKTTTSLNKPTNPQIDNTEIATKIETL